MLTCTALDSNLRLYTCLVRNNSFFRINLTNENVFLQLFKTALKQLETVVLIYAHVLGCARKQIKAKLNV